MSAEMTTLFRFWGELLAGNFNRSMYSEFYMLAAEDLPWAATTVPSACSGATWPCCPPAQGGPTCCTTLRRAPCRWGSWLGV